jgi:hypothetical protein
LNVQSNFSETSVSVYVHLASIRTTRLLLLAFLVPFTVFRETVLSRAICVLRSKTWKTMTIILRSNKSAWNCSPQNPVNGNIITSTSTYYSCRCTCMPRQLDSVCPMLVSKQVAIPLFQILNNYTTD